MIGTTGIRNLQIDCIVGIYEHERQRPQRVFVDVELDYDFETAARWDKIGDAVDYDDVAQQLTDLIRRQGFQLIETMAEAAAVMLLDQLGMVQTVRLEVRKPAAVPSADYSFVRIERRRS